MNENRKKIGIASLLASMVLAAELAILLDVAIVLGGTALSVLKFGILYVVLFLLILLIPGFDGKKKGIAAVVIAVAVAVPTAVGFLCWRGISKSVGYYAVDDGKAQLYGGQRVMLLVPHQDDDYNVLGGVMEEYVKYGSEVYVVFSTNGDYYGLAEERFQEALRALGSIGIGEDHVLFLGYGDGWDPDGPHIYNAEQVAISVNGRQETYGTQAHAAFREGIPYTAENFLSDIESVILTYLPDVIYCVDYDYHIDHRALSLGFEKVMGRILNTRQDYRPLVFKGYAYNSAWEAEWDFYEENLLATKNVFDVPEEPLPAVYRWEDRVRLPIHGESLSRSILHTKAYEILSCYTSQGANVRGARILNSDKVFWQRQTESLCYGAAMTASSSNPELLRDFMLLESRDLKENGDFSYDGVWIPAETDGDKQVQVTFEEPQSVDAIVLYDHPDREKNILNARISFDDGSALETGMLDPGGAASIFQVNKTTVSSFTVTILETQGQAGLTEIEAFGPDAGKLPDYGKLMDEAGNFVYDYWIDTDGVQDFTLYTNGIDSEAVVYSVDNPNCTVTQADGNIRVTCPKGECCIVSVLDENGKALDRVFVQNPGVLERSWRMFWLRVESAVLKMCEKQLNKRFFICRLYAKFF